ncbi:MAG: Asr1405/Asl0597 family protein [Cyanobacteria bacterium J06614_10]
MSSSNISKPSHVPADCPATEPARVTVSCQDRWQVYHRLQELDIDCQCGGFKPLIVDVQSATEAAQLWSVANRISESRQTLIARLIKSWELPAASSHNSYC